MSAPPLVLLNPLAYPGMVVLRRWNLLCHAILDYQRSNL